MKNIFEIYFLSAQITFGNGCTCDCSRKSVNLPFFSNFSIGNPNNIIFRFSDFGSSVGGTSQEMWSNIIKLIRETGDERQIEILYTDLASNDFSTLFKTMQGMHGNTNFAFQKKFSNIFIHGCGTGFHEQLMANNSLSLGFSATAMHYVSKRPCLIESHVHMPGASDSEKQLFKDQAHKDWETILLNRSNELIKGGRFVCINFGIDDIEDCVTALGHIEDNPENTNETRTKFIKLLMDDKLSQNQYIAVCGDFNICLLYTSPSPRDQRGSRMPCCG